MRSKLNTFAFAVLLVVALWLTAATSADGSSEKVVDAKGTEHQFVVSANAEQQASEHQAKFREQYGEVWQIGKHVVTRVREVLGDSGASADASSQLADQIPISAQVLSSALDQHDTWSAAVRGFDLDHDKFDPKKWKCFVRVSAVRVAPTGRSVNSSEAMREFKTSFRDKRSWRYKPRVAEEPLICSADHTTFIHHTKGRGYYTAVIEEWADGPELFSYWYETAKPTQRIAMGIDAAFVVHPDGIDQVSHVILVTVHVNRTDYSAKQHAAFRKNTVNRVDKSARLGRYKFGMVWTLRKPCWTRSCNPLTSPCRRCMVTDKRRYPSLCTR